MGNIARIGDSGIGVCVAHDTPISPASGTIVSGAATVFTNGSNVSRIGDTLVTDHDNGHTGDIIEGSPTVFAEGLNIARLGDSFSGVFSGTIVEGAPTVFSN